MTNIDVLKAYAIESLANAPEEPTKLLEGGAWFPNSFVVSLVKEIEELEERCGENHE